MNRLNLLDCKNVACRRAAEFVSTVRRADGNRQCVHSGFVHEICGLLRIGKHLLQRQDALRTNTIFLTRGTRFQRTKTAQLPFNRNTTRMSHINNSARYVNVVIVFGWGFLVLKQRPVHHHGAKP